MKIGSTAANPSIRIRLALILGAILCASSFAQGPSSEENGGSSTEGTLHLKSLRTHSQLVIPLDDGVTTELKNTPQGFELKLKGASVEDLGATREMAGVFKSQVSRMKDARLASVDFKQEGSDVLVQGTWKYPTGELTPAHPKVEVFEYRSRTPYPHYILDFWHATGLTRKQELARLAREKALAEAAAREKTWKERSERRIASQKRKAYDEDTTRFCKLPISTENDLFPRIGALHQPFEFSKWLPSTTPDTNYNYFEPTAGRAEHEAEGGKYVRLALSLYKRGDYALAARTVEFLEAEVPRSKFLPEMRFLRANAQVRLGLDESAERSLKSIVTEWPGSPIALSASSYLAVKQMEKKQWLASAETFNRLLQQYPSSPAIWVFHMGLAESFYHVRETDKAAKEYQWVIEKAQDADARAQAALRKGDLYMDRFFYDQALATYFQGFEYFPEAAQSFPSIWLNRAEALYWLGQFDRAKANFEEAIQKFPSHPELWRAHYRIGEILARAEYPMPASVADPKAEFSARQKAARKSWLVAVNSYPFSAGATLARMRLIPCEDHGGFTSDSMEKFYATDASELLNRPGISSFGLKDFIHLSHVRARIGMGLEAQAVDLATHELTLGRPPEVHLLFSGLVGSVFRKHILQLIAEGKKGEAVDFYRQKAPLLPKSHVYVDPDYLLKLSQAASDLGLSDLAKTLSESFEFGEKAKQASDRKIAQAGGTTRDLSEILADSEKAFTAAKALWGAGVKQDADSEEKIRSLLARVKPESPFSFEREVMLGLLENRHGRVATALGHAAKAQLLGGVGDIRFEAWLAGLTAKAGDPKLALAQLTQLERKLQAAQNAQENAQGSSAVAGMPAVPSRVEVIFALAEIREKLEQWGQAASDYSRAMALLPKDPIPTRATYAYARALLKEGSVESKSQAIQALTQVSESKTQDFWTKLARETLKTESSENVSKEGNKP